MHVGLNLVYLVPGQTGGMETYARELIPALVAAAPQARFTAFVNREAADDPTGPWAQLIPAVTVPVRARNRLEWVRGEQQLLPRLAARAGVQLVHSLGSTAPAWGRFRRVVTIHDLAYRLAPEAHLGLAGLGMRVLVPLAAHRSHRIIVPTECTRADVCRLLRVPPGRVDVIPEGVGTAMRSDALPEPALRTRLSLGNRPIVLCVSAKRPHKNLARLTGALARIPAERRPILVLPGYSTSHEPAELEGLYGAAACFIFPSLFEGFGLPVLEAMARGVPVACSGRAALAEVAGDAALLFDPDSEASIAAAIERLLRDRGEVERLRHAGIERAARFTWAATAAGTVASYEQALAGYERTLAGAAR